MIRDALEVIQSKKKKKKKRGYRNPGVFSTSLNQEKMERGQKSFSSLSFSHLLLILVCAEWFGVCFLVGFFKISITFRFRQVV